jgi:hypothetical protein
VQALGAVVARRPQLNPLVVRQADQVAPRDGLAATDALDPAIGEPHVGGMDPQPSGRHDAEPLDDLLAGVLDRTTVEVGPGAGRRR